MKKPLVNLPLASKGPHVGWKTAVRSHIMYIHTSHSMHVCVCISGCYVYTYSAKNCPVIKIALTPNMRARLIIMCLHFALWHQQPQLGFFLLLLFFLGGGKEEEMITAGGAFIIAVAAWERGSVSSRCVRGMFVSHTLEPSSSLWVSDRQLAGCISMHWKELANTYLHGSWYVFCPVCSA